MVSRCGESTSPDVQLAVVRALLTMTTAEHFRAHGDCLVQVLSTLLLSAALILDLFLYVLKCDT